MTETGARLERLARPYARLGTVAVALGGAGAALAFAAVGIRLAPRSAAILLAWIAIAAVAAGSVWAARRWRSRVAAPAVARLVERLAGARTGSVAAIVGPVAGVGTSAALLAAGDRRAARVVVEAGPAIATALARASRGRLAVGGAAAALGALLLIGASPGSVGAAAFWHPFRTWRDARAPVQLSVDRATVRRGDRVQVTLRVPGGSRAVLWTRVPGEPWRGMPVSLDSVGGAALALGPLTADLYLRAASGGRSSRELRVTVGLPAFLAELALTARYPAYLARPDEPLVPGPDTVSVPAGTEIVTEGAASVALARAAWVSGGTATAALRVQGSRFTGVLRPRSGAWRLVLAPADGAPLEGVAPALVLRVVPDSAPVVALPVPGRDTVLPLSLRQPLLIDARDDHGLSRLEVVSWRVSRTGKVGDPVREPLDVSQAGDRAIVPTELVLEGRGLLPGDTVRVQVEGWDNAPVPQRGRSAVLALRLASLEELRAATRAATRDIAEAAESLSTAQADVAERARDLAYERAREGAAAQRPAAPQAGTLPFQATERAEDVARRQAELQQRVAELAEAIEEVARAAEAAGIGDSVFQQRLAEVRALLERAVTPELEERLRALQEALARLDPEATRDALRRLAEAQQELREELERSTELFRRAAAEGALATLAADAEDLKQRQAEWTRDDAPRPDTAAAAREASLAAQADSLGRGIEQAARDARASLEGSQEAARRAAAAMRRAAAAAEQRDAPGAVAAGEAASEALEDLPDELARQRDSLAATWRREAVEALDRATSEAADLAQRQRDVATTLRRGDAAAGRRRQAAVEEGVAAVERQVRAAAGRNALVSPQLERALGYARHQMRSAREQLEQGEPNTSAAAALADQALDALNATVHALARSRSDVASARSGSGFQEAVERLARLAGQQQGLNAEAQGLMPMLGAGGEGVLEQLRAMAARQRALAEQLDRLRAEGNASGAGELAREAHELARQLEAGRLDRRTIERQQQLYRRLLDAGRTLSGQEPDEQKERTSRSATGDSVRRPGALAPGAAGVGPRLRYPTWEELRGLTPVQRRLVLEYFRRLNAPQ